MKIKKVSVLTFMMIFLIGCSSTNPPESPKAKGKWEVINSTIEDISKGF
ncbi:MAG TPA: hypothetical protein ACHBZ9_04700 [Arsenophonus nasoniae]